MVISLSQIEQVYKTFICFYIFAFFLSQEFFFFFSLNDNNDIQLITSIKPFLSFSLLLDHLIIQSTFNRVPYSHTIRTTLSPYYRSKMTTDSIAKPPPTHQHNNHHHHHVKHVSTPLSHTLSLIEHSCSKARFLILDCPTESTLSLYMEEFQNYNVSTVVRCCQPTYSAQRLLQNGISVVDLPFKDGGIVSSAQRFFI